MSISGIRGLRNLSLVHLYRDTVSRYITSNPTTYSQAFRTTEPSNTRKVARERVVEREGEDRERIEDILNSCVANMSQDIGQICVRQIEGEGERER
jgi:predicted transcriptional regulator